MNSTIETIDFHGLEALRLQVAGASAIISRQGGQILSWITPDGRERLYLSPRAVWDGSKPVRGGIPVCFPQFGEEGNLPRHGVVRTAQWNVSQTRNGDGFALATMETSGSVGGEWQCEITLMLERNRLDVEMGVVNTGQASLRFTGALHTYLRVTQVEDAEVEGLYGTLYEDALDNRKVKKETSPRLALEGPADRIYQDVARTLLVHAGNLSVGVDSDGFRDVVLWNPWESGCQDFPDLPADGWRHFLCLEAAAVAEPVEIAPGAEWSGRQTLVAV